MPAEFVQKKSLARVFARIGIDENDLARLASLLAENPVLSRENLTITVRSADGEDVFSTNDPEFFFDQSFPRVLSEVAISSQRYDAPVSCKIELASGERGQARLTVDGNDATAVSGLFHELSRELEARQLTGGWWVKQLDSFPFYLLIALALSSAVYSVFDLALDFGSSLAPAFADSTAHRVIAGIGWICVSGVFALSGFSGVRFFKRVFPVVQFRGRIEDEGQRLRGRLFWVISAILVPILVNVLSGAFADIFGSE